LRESPWLAGTTASVVLVLIAGALAIVGGNGPTGDPCGREISVCILAVAEFENLGFFTRGTHPLFDTQGTGE